MDPIRDINEATNIALESQMALGFAMPPFIPFRTSVVVKGSDDVEGSAELNNRLQSGLVENTNWIVPLTFKADTLEDFKFPLDPIISLSSKNIIIRRYVNKSKTRGSIKERWSQDDWDITISGMIIEADEDARNNIINQLRSFCDIPKSVDVICDLLNRMDIQRIAIEGIDFPFTKGIENQAFSIKAYSDETYTLLI